MIDTWASAAVVVAAVIVAVDIAAIVIAVESDDTFFADGVNDRPIAISIAIDNPTDKIVDIFLWHLVVLAERESVGQGCKGYFLNGYSAEVVRKVPVILSVQEGLSTTARGVSKRL